MINADYFLPGCFFSAPKPHRSSCRYLSFSVEVLLIDLLITQDISHENFLMNFYGVTQPPRDRGRKPPILRGLFPVKYSLIDFGCSIQFSPDADPSSYLGTWKVSRQQRAPETTTGKPFDPFAADVYQTGRTIYGWCMVRYKAHSSLCPATSNGRLLVQKFKDDIPAVLAVLQDMTRSRPDTRLNVTEACLQMSAAIEATSCAIRETEIPTSYAVKEYEEVPPRRSLYVYGCSPY
jgi:serine/threonine protein kinase